MTTRLDLKCGNGAISQGEKCHVGVASKSSEREATLRRERVRRIAAVGVGLGTAAAVAYLSKRRGKLSKAPTPPSPQPDHTVQSQRNIEAGHRAAQGLADRVIGRNSTPPVTRPASSTSVPSSSVSRVEIPEGWRDVIRNEKHNYVMGKHPDFNAILGRSITPKGNIIDFKLGSSGEVEFRVNGDTNRRQTFSREEGTMILSRVERMLQASIKDLPDSEYIWTNAYSNDGLGKKRLKLYTRYGFQRDPSDPTSKELGTTVGALKKRNRRNDSFRTNSPGRRCGQGYIAAGKKCQQKGAFPPRKAIAVGLAGAGLTAGAIALHRRRTRITPVGVGVAGPVGLLRGSSPSARAALPGDRTTRALPGDRTTRRITGTTPYGLLPPRPPKSKTQRLRENSALAARRAERDITRAAQAEITRAGAVANAMASAGEATGMATKTTMRELRLRVEAARRRFEPGYRRGRPAAQRPQPQLPEGGSRFQVPFNPSTPRRPAPDGIPIDPRPRRQRRRPRGFGGRTDNYIPVYAPVRLSRIQ